MGIFFSSKLLNIIASDYLIFTFIFFTLSLVGILHHELWLDEAHHWLLARDSTSFSNLIINTRYEGHPILWNILLYFISRFSLNPFWMQLLHIIISSLAVFIFFKNAPFSRLFKIFFIFGYFMFFEYNLLSRNYSLGVLFLFLACCIYSSRKEKFLLFAIVLTIANNTHAIFIVITTCLLFTVLMEGIQKNGFQISKKTGFGLTIFVLGTLLAVIQIIPPTDTTFFQRIDDLSMLQKIPKSLITFFKGVFFIPDFRTIHFWNTHLIVNLNKSVAAILGILSFFIPYLLFYKNRIVLTYTYLAIIGTGVFFFITQLSAPRYFGINYLIIISGLWMNHYHTFTKNRFNSLLSKISVDGVKNVIIYSILTIQLISGILAYSIEIAKPFTSSKQVITFLNKHNLSHKVIATVACDGTALSSYLERPVFFTNSNKYQSYCIWGDPIINTSLSKESIIESLQGLLNTLDETLIFISYQPIFNINSGDDWKIIDEKIKYKFLKSFEESIINKGDYYIYEVSKK
ncbi:hypothetical protein [Aquimarina sp. 2201CG5-10]|uniref:hypothetical protein n=1 Tax=Aquimarina callyspongiae TaxID=3098150 RepID=UPI002AB44A1B|nr:hypothetical protein [Aquimarina sp. 2201CG5-10]MDY8138868.1 hypothetical protein [Aquimarina sp. 2201CG5-10]